MDQYEINGGGTPPIGTLLDGIFADAKNLLVHEVNLGKLEFRFEVQKLQTAVVVLGIGAVLLAIGLSLVGLMAAQLIAMHTQIPLWGAYGIVGGGLVLIGTVVIITRARRRDSD
jgi:hypothetical protein